MAVKSNPEYKNAPFAMGIIPAGRAATEPVFGMRFRVEREVKPGDRDARGRFLQPGLRLKRVRGPVVQRELRSVSSHKSGNSGWHINIAMCCSDGSGELGFLSSKLSKGSSYQEVAAVLRAQADALDRVARGEK